MGAGVATGPHCPSSMARLPARRPAGRVVRERAEARSIPLVGRERRRSAALSHPVSGSGGVSPPLLLPDPSGEAAEAVYAVSRFPSVARGANPACAFQEPFHAGAEAFAHPGLRRSRGKPCSLGSRPFTPGKPAAVPGGFGSGSRNPLSLRRFEKLGIRQGRSPRIRRPFPEPLAKRPKPPRRVPFGRSRPKPKLLPDAATFLKCGGDSPFLQKALGNSHAPESASLPERPLGCRARFSFRFRTPGFPLAVRRRLASRASIPGDGFASDPRPVALSGFASFPPLHPSGYRNDAVSISESRKA
jgi:hypothetical protein